MDKAHSKALDAWENFGESELEFILAIRKQSEFWKQIKIFPCQLLIIVAINQHPKRENAM